MKFFRQADAGPGRIRQFFSDLRNEGIKRKYLALLLMLFILIIIQPCKIGFISEDSWVKLLNTFVFIAGINAVSENRRQFIISLLIVIPAIIATWLFLIQEIPSVEIVANLLTLLFYTFLTVVVVLHIIRTDKIWGDTVYGALCGYILIGITYASGYGLLYSIFPGSFYINPNVDPLGVQNPTEFLYFSFVTLATLGYGDILPVTDQARIMAMLEAVTGVLFVAVLVARIVGSYTHSR